MNAERDGLPVLVMPSGAAIWFDGRVDGIRIADIADMLSRLAADPCVRFGLYSWAQRSAIVSRHVALKEGALTALHALLYAAPIVLVDQRFQHSDADGEAVIAALDRIDAAQWSSLDLDPPTTATRRILLDLFARLRLSELICLRTGIDDVVAERRGTGVLPLVGTIAPQNWDVARDSFLGNFRHFATLAGLRRTPAWAGIT